MSKVVLVFRICVALAAFVASYAQPMAVHAEGIRERIVENNLEFVPPGDGSFPTIIAIPGRSGDRLFRRHYLLMAERLRAEGFAVLLIHLHRAEGLMTACRGEISGERIAEYIDDSVAWAKGRPPLSSKTFGA